MLVVVSHCDHVVSQVADADGRATVVLVELDELDDVDGWVVVEVAMVVAVVLVVIVGAWHDAGGGRFEMQSALVTVAARAFDVR